MESPQKTEIEYVTQKDFQKHKAKINRRVNGLEDIVGELRLSNAKTNAILTNIELNTRETKESVKEQAVDQKKINEKLNEHAVSLVKIESEKDLSKTKIDTKGRIIVAVIGAVGIGLTVIAAIASPLANYFFK
ncbi:hypothetical protein [Listeria newyorkensis]|uniref:hypothetical protein n=1 Tax=Listeria newyorkensis TaxID=1497681 RepID=UPI00051D840A|nr:hypothetical protein [Listeria newyorkensis]KGL44136.1 hypothetical protein EP58_06725 [Listeria newyorkensis]SQC57715.1 Uncharacterised protein [Listeria newyorkensis]